MKIKILHETTGRIRFHILQKEMSVQEADVLEKYISEIKSVKKVKVYECTCDVIVAFTGKRDNIFGALKNFDYQRVSKDLGPIVSSRLVNKEFREKLVRMILMRTLGKIFVPFRIKRVWILMRSLRYFRGGLACVRHRKMKVEILDALSIGVSMGRGDFYTASSVMFLLKIGELLEEWTRKKAINDLAKSMALNVDKAWLRTENGEEILLPVNKIKKDDIVCVRTGNIIPFDGIVVNGVSEVNQSSLTGESVAVRKTEGATVYAGTVIEEGDLAFRVTNAQGNSRYDQIVKIINESDQLKSVTETRALALADRLVPYSLLGTALTFLLTRNIIRATSILMVDFSCALKLSMPLSVLSAMRECGNYGITVKGGKFIEAIAKADTIVFDKTGTLTYATPSVAMIVPFDNHSEDEVLRMAACLEEHYPHSMANAVVRAAEKKGIIHEENHTKVEYVVAHGIASRVDGRKVVIGSYHFVFEDEKCVIPEGEVEKFNSISENYSHLYLADDGKLIGVICIHDPLRPEAKKVLEELHALGIKHTVMMTGDNERIAKTIAREVGVDEYFAEVLPEDKANYIKKKKAEGCKVIMIGDGINDSPALSCADVGIAISNGAPIAREVADITISQDNLDSLPTLKRIADGLLKRVKNNNRFALGFNGGLIVLGAMGFLWPAQSAVAHNLSTLALSLHSMTNILPDNEYSETKKSEI